MKRTTDSKHVPRRERPIRSRRLTPAHTSSHQLTPAHTSSHTHQTPPKSGAMTISPDFRTKTFGLLQVPILTRRTLRFGLF